MEYPITELNNAVEYLLTMNSDTPMSLNQIFNSLCEEKICPELASLMNREENKLKFTTVCYTLDGFFKNIHKYTYKNALYLMFSHKSKAEAVIFMNKYFNNNLVTPMLSDNVDLCDVIDFALKHPEYNSTLKMSEYIDGNNTALHIVCEHKRSELLDALLAKHTINIDSLNSQGKKAYDILIENNAPSTMVQRLTDYKLATYETKLKVMEQSNVNLRNMLNKVQLCALALGGLNVLQYLYL